MGLRRQPLKTSAIVIISVFLLLQETNFVLGGNCWLNQNRDGRCTALVKAGSTKEECCNNGPISSTESVSWSDEELTPSSLFYILHIQGGVSCSRCHENSCDGIRCRQDQKCVVRNGHPKCVCSPNCSSFRLQHGVKGRIRGPVCGSDGKTYKTSCRLLKRSCRRKVSLSISYYGPCKTTCSKLMCPGKKMCLLDQNMIPHCVNCTTRHCSNNNGPVLCGVDGITYQNRCQLRRLACQKGKAIQVAYKGQCKKRANCSNIKCNEGQSCLKELFSTKPRCVTCSTTKSAWCSENDGSIKGPICSTNGKTYKNWCDMIEDGCKTGFALDTKHFGRCKASIQYNNSTTMAQ